MPRSVNQEDWTREDADYILLQQMFYRYGYEKLLKWLREIRRGGV